MLECPAVQWVQDCHPAVFSPAEPTGLLFMRQHEGVEVVRCSYIVVCFIELVPMPMLLVICQPHVHQPCRLDSLKVTHHSFIYSITDGLLNVTFKGNMMPIYRIKALRVFSSCTAGRAVMGMYTAVTQVQRRPWPRLMAIARMHAVLGGAWPADNRAQHACLQRVWAWLLQGQGSSPRCAQQEHNTARCTAWITS